MKKEVKGSDITNAAATAVDNLNSALGDVQAKVQNSESTEELNEALDSVKPSDIKEAVAPAAEGTDDDLYSDAYKILDDVEKAEEAVKPNVFGRAVQSVSLKLSQVQETSQRFSQGFSQTFEPIQQVANFANIDVKDMAGQAVATRINASPKVSGAQKELLVAFVQGDVKEFIPAEKAKKNIAATQKKIANGLWVRVKSLYRSLQKIIKNNKGAFAIVCAVIIITLAIAVKKRLKNPKQATDISKDIEATAQIVNESLMEDFLTEGFLDKMKDVALAGPKFIFKKIRDIFAKAIKGLRSVLSDLAAWLKTASPASIAVAIFIPALLAITFAFLFIGRAFLKVGGKG